MALRMGKRLARLCLSKQSTTAKEKEDMDIAHLSSSKYKLETKDVNICKTNVTRHA